MGKKIRKTKAIMGDELPLKKVQTLFENEPRPEHFTNYMHCEECYDHDQTLLQYPRDSLPLEKLAD